MTEAEKTALRSRRAYFHTGLPTYSIGLPAALNVLDAIGNPLTDNDVLAAGWDATYSTFDYHHADRLYRFIRYRIEALGLTAGYQFSDGLEAMVKAVSDRNPVQTCEEPPRAVERNSGTFDMDAYDAWRAENQPCEPSRPRYDEINIFSR